MILRGFKLCERDPLSTMHWAHPLDSWDCTEILYSTARIGILTTEQHRKWNQILLLLSEFTAVPSKGVDWLSGARQCHAEPSLQAAENRRHSIDH
jgi:hypothetical protein